MEHDYDPFEAVQEMDAVVLHWDTLKMLGTCKAKKYQSLLLELDTNELRTVVNFICTCANRSNPRENRVIKSLRGRRIPSTVAINVLSKNRIAVQALLKLIIRMLLRMSVSHVLRLSIYDNGPR